MKYIILLTLGVPAACTSGPSTDSNAIAAPAGKAASSGHASRAGLGDDDYAIYRVVVRHQWIDVGISPLTLVRETGDAADSEDFDRASQYLRDSLSKNAPPVVVEDDLLAAYRRVRAREDPLDLKRLTVAGVAGASDEDTSGSPRGSTSGLITLSRIGFAHDGRRGLLSASRFCGGLCGEGYYILVEKLDGRWRVVASVMAWVA